jgi:hypothetical protein
MSREQIAVCLAVDTSDETEPEAELLGPPL